MSAGMIVFLVGVTKGNPLTMLIGLAGVGVGITMARK